MSYKEQQFLVHIILLKHFNMCLYNILSSFEAKKYQLLVLVKPSLLRPVVSPGRTLRLRRERNHCEQPFAFPSSMRVHVTPRSKRQMTSLSLVLQETLREF